MSGVVPGPDYPFWNCDLGDAWIKFSSGTWFTEFRRIQDAEKKYMAALRAPPKEIALSWPSYAARASTARDHQAFRKNRDDRYLSEIATRKRHLVAEATTTLLARLGSGALVAFGVVAPPLPGKAPEQIPAWWWTKHELAIDWKDSAVSLAGGVVIDVRVYFASELGRWIKDQNAPASAEGEAPIVELKPDHAHKSSRRPTASPEQIQEWVNQVRPEVESATKNRRDECRRLVRKLAASTPEQYVAPDDQIDAAARNIGLVKGGPGRPLKTDKLV